MRKLSILAALILCFCTSCASIMTGTKEADKKSTAVVCIGMQRSAAFGECPGAGIDATRMYNILTKYSDDAKLLISNQAIYTNVRAAMIAACQKDLAIIYYSGHGGSQKQKITSNTTYVEPSGHDSFLCLYNAAMMDDEIWAIVSQAKGRVVLMFDCCHSATMFRGFPIMTFAKQTSALAASTEKDGPRLLVLSGCDDLSYSYGADDGGLMTNLFLRKYKNTKSYDEVFSAVEKNKELGRSQNVHFTEIGKSFKALPIFH